MELVKSGRTDVLLFMLSSFVAGIILLVQTNKKRTYDKFWSPPSVDHWVALALLYIPSGYIIAYLGSKLRSQLLFPLLFFGNVAIFLLLHICWQVSITITSRRIRAELSDTHQEKNAALVAYSQLTALGILSFSHNGVDSEMAESFRREIELSTVTRIFVHDVDIFVESSGIIGNILVDAAQSGIDIRIFANSSSKARQKLSQISQITSFNLKEFWLIQTSWSVYIMVATFGGCILRFKRVESENEMTLPAAGVENLLYRIEKDISIESNAAHAVVQRGPASYRDNIMKLEEQATRIDRIAKRIFVVFKDDSTIKAISKQRYGEGSSYLSEYVKEHKERKRLFERAIARGAVFREIYSTTELLTYVSTGKHGVSAILHRQNLVATVANWMEAIRNVPNYHVALCDEPVPFHYEIIDERHVVFHEAIGVHESTRVNSIFLDGYGTASDFQNEFDALWDRVPAERRRSEGVIQWLEINILPNLKSS